MSRNMSIVGPRQKVCKGSEISVMSSFMYKNMSKKEMKMGTLSINNPALVFYLPRGVRQF